MLHARLHETRQLLGSRQAARCRFAEARRHARAAFEVRGHRVRERTVNAGLARNVAGQHGRFCGQFGGFDRERAERAFAAVKGRVKQPAHSQEDDALDVAVPGEFIETANCSEILFERKMFTALPASSSSRATSGIV